MDEINLSDYARILGYHSKMMLVVTLVVVLFAGVYLVITPKVYMGTTMLLFPERSGGSISPQLAQLAGIMLPGGGLPSLSGPQIYILVMKSRTLSDTVCKRLDLGQYDVTYSDLQECLTTETPKDGGLAVKCNVPTSWLKGHVPGSELKQRTAELSARLANTYISELRTYQRTNSLSMGRKNRIFIEGQIERTKAELTGAEIRLQRFQQQHPTLVPPDKSSAYADQALGLAEKQSEAEVALHEALGQLERARATWKAGAPQGISPEAAIDDPAISELRTQLARLEVKRATLLENFTDSHPEVVSLTQEINKTQKTVQSVVDRIIAGKSGSISPASQELMRQLVILEVSRGGLEARGSALAAAISNVESRLSKLPSQEMEYARLIRQVKTNEVVYTTLLGEHAKARIAEGRDTDDFIVLDAAIAPKGPSKPRTKITLIAALMCGVMLGVLTATVRGIPVTKR